ncbi:MAG: ribonuclease [Solobacterium sp.]|jgi:guanyl-specific ribonuclease Sa|nr:ribonuclease [Solobacterium sp.]MCH4222795.1 ribonuclease [Solobacterium sp.]MCH4266179.1 ribonuclease [Solobacterium sp.]
MESLKKLMLSLLACTMLWGCTVKDTAAGTTSTSAAASIIDESGTYDSKEDVALYLETYWHLPDNYMTKKEARKEGWSGGALSATIPGKCIGGDVYGNYEGTLPEVDGRTYYECDIDTLGKTKRGAERIIWSTDQNIYYTEDHYDTFTLIYGDDAQ